MAIVKVCCINDECEQEFTIEDFEYHQEVECPHCNYWQEAPCPECEHNPCECTYCDGCKTLNGCSCDEQYEAYKDRERGL